MSKREEFKHEQRRTAILLTLLMIAIGFIYYVQNNVDSNFQDQLDEQQTSLEV